MFSFFSKKLKPQEVCDVFDNTFPNLDFKGYPEKSERTASNWSIVYKFATKDSASYCIASKCDGISFYFCAEFLVDKVRTTQVKVRLENVDLSYSKEGFAKLKETYDSFNIFQDGKSLFITSKNVPCKDVSDVRKVINNFYSDWNNSGIYPLIVKLSKLK